MTSQMNEPLMLVAGMLEMGINTGRIKPNKAETAIEAAMRVSVEKGLAIAGFTGLPNTDKVPPVGGRGRTAKMAAG